MDLYPYFILKFITIVMSCLSLHFVSPNKLLNITPITILSLLLRLRLPYSSTLLNGTPILLPCQVRMAGCVGSNDLAFKTLSNFTLRVLNALNLFLGRGVLCWCEGAWKGQVCPHADPWALRISKPQAYMG